jgi:ATP-dependent Clp protease adaptor protein ClpS
MLGTLDMGPRNGQNSDGNVSAMATKKPAQRPEHDDGLAIAERMKTERPRRYHVVFHNDDYTTMEFVVYVLIKFFHKSETEATQIMLHVHHKGYGIVGVYTRDVAETKAAQVMDYAKEHGHPLRCTAEPEGFGESE